MRSYKSWISASISALILLFAVSAFAAITGTISGTVSDASGAVMPGVTVTVLNQDTGIKQTKVTDGKGFFSFPALDVGTYTVSVSQTGFASYTEANIRIDANSDVRADVSLKVGAVTQITEVTANPVQIETQSSQLGEVIESQKMTDVPLNGRAFTDLMLLQPGVSPYSGKAESSTSSEPAVSGALNGGNISVNGGRESSNGYMVNGADVNDGVENSTAVIPNLDSIGEFRIITDNYSAEYGNFSGGQVNVVTKSGTNKFHGSAFEFLRNTNFNARNYYATSVAPYDQNIWGGTAGGPIKKDKLFFFADFQGTNNTQAQVDKVQTLSSNDESGNVSEGEDLIAGINPLVPADDSNPYTVNGTGWASVLSNRVGYTISNGEPYDYLPGSINPVTGSAYGTSCNSTAYNAATGLGCAFPGSVIPKSAWDPVAANLFKYIPAPNATGSSALPGSTYAAGVVPTYLNSSLATTLVDKKTSGRGDLNTRYGTFFVYYFMDQFNQVNPYGGGSDGEFPASTKGRTMLSNIGLTTTFKNNAVNSARISYMRSNYYSGFPDYPTPGPSLASLGFLTPWGAAGGISPIDAPLEGVPETSIEGIGMGLPDAVVGHREGTFQGLDNYMKVVGTHTLTFGANYHFDLITERNNDENNGSFSFSDSTTETGFGVADFLLGAVSNSFTQSSDQYLDARSYYFGAFAQDSWRAKSNLTLNYGIRYEITTPWWDTKNRLETIVLGEQSQVFPNSPLGWVYPGDKGVPNTLAFIKYNKFAPRFGFAYTPNGTGIFSKLLGGANHTSIRGGFGVFFTSYQQMSVYQEAGDVPFGNYYSASIPSLLYAPYVNRADDTVTSQPFPFNWPPADTSVAHPFTGYNFAAAGPISGSPGVGPSNTVPYLEEYNLNIQRQIGSNTVFSIAYVGSEGKHLGNDIPQNEGNPALCASLSGSALQAGQTACGPNLETQTYILANGNTQYGTRAMNIAAGCICFGSESAEVTEGISNFNALETQIKHSSRMFDFLLGYTWERSMDNSSSQTGATNNLYPHLAYGESTFNVPQFFTGSYTVHSPFDTRGNRFVRNVAGGWAISGITKLAKGTPLKISNSGDKSETATNFDVPFYTPGNLFAGGTMGDKNPRDGKPYFNTTLFTKEKTGQFGNTYRDFFVGPGLDDTDLTLQRYFHIHESHQVEFRAEAFNFMNHTNFGSPGTSVTSGSFGLISSEPASPGPRVLQLAWKYNF